MAEVLKEKGNECFKKGEFKKAAKLYRDAIALDPNNPVIYSNRSMCFTKLEDWKRTLEDCEMGISLCEQNKEKNKKTLVKLLYRKGLAISKVGKDLKIAEASWKYGLKLDGSNGLIKKELENYYRNTSKSNEIQISRNLDIEEVDSLPIYYQKIIDGTSLDKQRVMEVDEISEEKIEEDSKKIKHNYSFPKTPSLYYLSCLIREPVVSFEPYLYIINEISPLQYSTIFAKGIESDFLDYFITGSILLIKEDYQFIRKITKIMKVLDVCPRFELSKLLCDGNKLNQLIELLKENNLSDLSFLHKWE